jgi:hypothetical protein
MAQIGAVTIQAELIDAALRLVDDHPGTPAGSVLRCYSRMVRLMRRAGTPMSQLPTEAEALTSQVLAARNRPGGAARASNVVRRDLGGREFYAVSA